MNCSSIPAMPDVIFVINGIQYPVSASAYTEQVGGTQLGQAREPVSRSFCSGCGHLGFSHSLGTQGMGGHRPAEQCESRHSPHFPFCAQISSTKDPA